MESHYMKNTRYVANSAILLLKYILYRKKDSNNKIQQYE